MGTQGTGTQGTGTQGIEYISGLTASEIKTLEESGIMQMTLFDKDLAEVAD